MLKFILLFACGLIFISTAQGQWTQKYVLIQKATNCVAPIKQTMENVITLAPNKSKHVDLNQSVNNVKSAFTQMKNDYQWARVYNYHAQKFEKVTVNESSTPLKTDPTVPSVSQTIENDAAGVRQTVRLILRSKEWCSGQNSIKVNQIISNSGANADHSQTVRLYFVCPIEERDKGKPSTVVYRTGGQNFRQQLVEAFVCYSETESDLYNGRSWNNFSGPINF